MSGHSWSGDRTYAAQQQPEPQRRECRSLNLLGHQRTPKIRFFPTSNHCRLPIMFAGLLLHHSKFHRSILRALKCCNGECSHLEAHVALLRREEARAEGINRNPLGNWASTAIRAVGIHQVSDVPTNTGFIRGRAPSRGFSAVRPNKSNTNQATPATQGALLHHSYLLSPAKACDWPKSDWRF